MAAVCRTQVACRRDGVFDLSLPGFYGKIWLGGTWGVKVQDGQRLSASGARSEKKRSRLGRCSTVVYCGSAETTIMRTEYVSRRQDYGRTKSRVCLC
jgi:hypothetical protein